MEFTEVLLAVLASINVILAIFIVVILKSKKETGVLEELNRNKETQREDSKRLKEDIQNNMNMISDFQRKQLEIFSSNLNDKTVDIRKTLDERLKELKEENEKKLEEMRMTVDEKLHESLEKRLGEAFKQVSERLEKVHQGLGEMQKLADGVGDLKRVLNNVKTRGTFGEVQLEAQLSEYLTTSQYDKNVKTKKNSDALVEFAIKLPGRNDDDVVYIPLDSKFPLDKYEKLVNAYDNADNEIILKARKELLDSIKIFAKDIRDKYIDPPNTTDFALMYLPTEGLYSEVIRDSKVIEMLQRDYKILPVGPTNLLAILNSLRIGFKTLAIEKHSSEVWKLLGAVKTQFGKFGDLLDKTHKKLSEASKTIEDASRKTRYIQGRLNKVDDITMEDSISMLGNVEDVD